VLTQAHFTESTFAQLLADLVVLAQLSCGWLDASRFAEISADTLVITTSSV
jgi:hypothetical protein